MDHSPDGALAELADIVITVARELQSPHAVVDGVVPLTPTEAAVLRHIDRRPGLSPGALAAATGLHRTNLSTTLRALETKGLIRRSHDERDARSVAVHPTASAKESIRRIRTHWGEILRAAMGGDLTAVNEALAVLERLENGLKSRR